MNTLIRASAGSGKTYALTTEYLRLLRDRRRAALAEEAEGEPSDAGLRVEALLAATFTRKAAGEIFDRILARLAAATLESKGLADLQAALGDPPLTQTECGDLLLRLCRSLHRLSIGTLDSFFGRLCAVYGAEAGLTRAAQMTDPKSPRCAALQRDALRAMLGAMLPEQSESLLDGLTRNKASSRVLPEFQGLLNDLSETLDGLGDDVWDAIAVPPAPAPEAIDAAQAFLRDAAPAFRLESWRKALLSDLDRLEARQWEEFLTKGLSAGCRKTPAKYGNGKEEIPPEIVTQYEALHAQATAELLGGLQRRTRAIQALLTNFAQHYEALRRAEGLLLFSEPPKLLDGLLGEAAETARRLDGTVEHLLLDEFQDTSDPQWGLLQSFALQAAAGPGSVFVVGDAKQAIYGWRGGRAEIFERIGTVIPRMETQNRDVSYRSAQTVLDAVNAVFQNLPGNEALNADAGLSSERRPPPTPNAVDGGGSRSSYPRASRDPSLEGKGEEKEGEAGILSGPPLPFLGEGLGVRASDSSTPAQRWSVYFQPHQAAESLHSLPGRVELSVSPMPSDPAATDAEDADEDDENADAPRHLVKCAERIAAEVRRLPATDTVGVLVRTNKTVAQLTDLLRAQGIGVSSEGLGRIADDPAIELILSALTFADHPGHTAAAYHVASSPLAASLQIGPDDYAQPRRAQAAASRLRRQILVQGYAGMLAGWAARLAPFGPERTARRLEQLVDLASEFDALPPMRPSEFVRAVRESAVENPGAARIRVMTINRAKGLEFDAVFLPELNWRAAPSMKGCLVKRASVEAITAGQPPIEAVYAYPNKTLQDLLPDLADAAQAAQDEETTGMLCLLYVAMTRAKKSLFMYLPPRRIKADGSPGTLGLSPAALLRCALGTGPDDARQGPDWTTLYQASDPAWNTRTPEKEDTPAPSEPPRPVVRFRPSDGTRRSALPRQSTDSETRPRTAADLLRLEAAP